MKFKDIAMTTTELTTIIASPLAKNLFCSKEIEFIISFVFPDDTKWTVYFNNEHCGYTSIMAETKIGHVNFVIRCYEDSQYVHIYSDKGYPFAVTKHFVEDEFFFNGVKMVSVDGKTYSDGIKLCKYTSDQMEELVKEIRGVIWGSAMELKSGFDFSNGAKEAFEKHKKFIVRWHHGCAVFRDASTGFPFWETSKVVKIERFGNGYCCLHTASDHKYNLTL